MPTPEEQRDQLIIDIGILELSFEEACEHPTIKSSAYQMAKDLIRKYTELHQLNESLPPSSDSRTYLLSSPSYTKDMARVWGVVEAAPINRDTPELVGFCRTACQGLLSFNQKLSEIGPLDRSSPHYISEADHVRTFFTDFFKGYQQERLKTHPSSILEADLLNYLDGRVDTLALNVHQATLVTAKPGDSSFAGKPTRRKTGIKELDEKPVSTYEFDPRTGRTAGPKPFTVKCFVDPMPTDSCEKFRFSPTGNSRCQNISAEIDTEISRSNPGTIDDNLRKSGGLLVNVDFIWRRNPETGEEYLSIYDASPAPAINNNKIVTLGRKTAHEKARLMEIPIWSKHTLKPFTGYLKVKADITVQDLLAVDLKRDAANMRSLIAEAGGFDTFREVALDGHLSGHFLRHLEKRPAFSSLPPSEFSSLIQGYLAVQDTRTIESNPSSPFAALHAEIKSVFDSNSNKSFKELVAGTLPKSINLPEGTQTANLGFNAYFEEDDQKLPSEVFQQITTDPELLAAYLANYSNMRAVSTHRSRDLFPEQQKDGSIKWRPANFAPSSEEITKGHDLVTKTIQQLQGEDYLFKNARPTDHPQPGFKQEYNWKLAAELKEQAYKRSWTELSIASSATVFNTVDIEDNIAKKTGIYQAVQDKTLSPEAAIHARHHYLTTVDEPEYLRELGFQMDDVRQMAELPPRGVPPPRDHKSILGAIAGVFARIDDLIHPCKHMEQISIF